MSKYISKNFELVVQLSKNVDEDLTENHYTDNKFIKAVEKKDLEVSDKLSTYVVNKKIFKWDTKFLNVQPSNLNDEYFTKEWIKIFIKAKLELIEISNIT